MESVLTGLVVEMNKKLYFTTVLNIFTTVFGVLEPIILKSGKLLDGLQSPYILEDSYPDNHGSPSSTHFYAKVTFLELKSGKPLDGLLARHSSYNCALPKCPWKNVSFL